MPFISPDDGYLTLFNIFETADAAGQDRVLDEMRAIVDNADYSGWISSTVHGAVDRPGTANYIQWRSLADLQARYAGEKFKKQTVPLFEQLATDVKLIRTEVVHAQRHPALDRIEISPDRDDYTVIIVFGVRPDDQKELVETLAQPEEWLETVPGYRSHTYLRGIEDNWLVNYAQWESREAYEAFHHMPEEQRPADVRAARLRARSLVTSRTANTYRVVHSRSARDDR